MTAHISNAADEYDRPMEVFELAMDMLGALCWSHTRAVTHTRIRPPCTIATLGTK
jgi:hypothetical protein|eukprot:COSAG06_NODE_2475_length_6797_cov_4.794267_5_plen_55_part_00